MTNNPQGVIRSLDIDPRDRNKIHRSYLHTPHKPLVAKTEVYYYWLRWGDVFDWIAIYQIICMRNIITLYIYIYRSGENGWMFIIIVMKNVWKEMWNSNDVDGTEKKNIKINGY